jgi:hypothetical protein
MGFDPAGFPWPAPLGCNKKNSETCDAKTPRASTRLWKIGPLLDWRTAAEGESTCPLCFAKYIAL